MLSDKQILEAISSGKLEIDPFIPELLGPNSYDVRLNNDGFAVLVGKDYEPIDPYDPLTYKYKKFSIVKQYTMEPGQFLIASIMERTHFKHNVSGELTGKSSLARLGLAVHVTAGLADIGWNGVYVLELVNHSGRPFVLTAGMPIAQIMFFETGDVLEAYGDKKRSKYQFQQPGQGSKYYLNERTVNEHSEGCCINFDGGFCCNCGGAGTARLGG